VEEPSFASSPSTISSDDCPFEFRVSASPLEDEPSWEGDSSVEDTSSIDESFSATLGFRPLRMIAISKTTYELLFLGKRYA
jgi:hypothetical protein